MIRSSRPVIIITEWQVCTSPAFVLVESCSVFSWLEFAAAPENPDYQLANIQPSLTSVLPTTWAVFSQGTFIQSSQVQMANLLSSFTIGDAQGTIGRYCMKVTCRKSGWLGSWVKLNDLVIVTPLRVTDGIRFYFCNSTVMPLPSLRYFGYKAALRHFGLLQSGCYLLPSHMYLNGCNPAVYKWNSPGCEGIIWGGALKSWGSFSYLGPWRKQVLFCFIVIWAHTFVSLLILFLISIV